MTRVVFWPCASAVALFLVVLLSHHVGCAAPPVSLEATMVDPSWPNADRIPPLELILGQNFAVSVMTRSFGVFNATLRMHNSPSFPERIHGELIPRGEAVLSMTGQQTLSHFTREREVEDDQMSETFVGMGSGGGVSGQGGVGVSAVQRPTLLSMDIQLRHSDSPLADVKVFYIPADLDEMQTMREQMQEGVAQPTLTANAHMHMDNTNRSVFVLSDIPALIRSASSTLNYGKSPSAAAAAEEKAVSHDAAAQRGGSFTIHFSSEHEFSASLLLPMGEGANSTLEPIWIYGYTVPTGLINRDVDRTFMQKYGLLCLSLFGFVLQVIIGIMTQRATQQQQQRRQQSAPTPLTTTPSAASIASAETAKKEIIVMSAYALDNFIKRVFESPDLILLKKINTDYNNYVTHLSDVALRSSTRTAAPGTRSSGAAAGGSSGRATLSPSPHRGSRTTYDKDTTMLSSCTHAPHSSPSGGVTGSVHPGRRMCANALRRHMDQAAQMLCYERALYPVISYPGSYDEVIALTLYHNFHAKSKLVFEMKQGGVTNYDVQDQQNDSIVVDAGVRGDASSSVERELYNLLSFPIISYERKKAAAAAAAAARLANMRHTVRPRARQGSRSSSAGGYTPRSNIANTPHFVPGPKAETERERSHNDAHPSDLAHNTTTTTIHTGKSTNSSEENTTSHLDMNNSTSKGTTNHESSPSHSRTNQSTKIITENASQAFSSEAKPETIVGVDIHAELGLAARIADVIFANLEEDSYIACTTDDSCCYVYCMDRGRQAMPRGVLSSHTGRVTRMAICRKASLYATCGTDGVLSIMDSLTLRCVCNLPHPAAVTCTTFSSDCRFLITGCADHCCRVWNSRVSYQPTSIAAYAKHTKPISALAPHPQSNVMASGCDGGAVHLWSVITTKKLYALPSHVHRGHGIRSLGFHRNGCVLISVSATRLVCSDVATGTITHTARPSELQELPNAYPVRRRATELQESSMMLTDSPRAGRASSEAQAFHTFGTFHFGSRRGIGFGGAGVGSNNNPASPPAGSSGGGGNYGARGSVASVKATDPTAAGGGSDHRRSSAFGREGGGAAESLTFTYVLFAPSRVPANFLVVCLSDKTVALVELILVKTNGGDHGGVTGGGKGNVQDILSRANPTAARRLRKMRNCASVTFPSDGEPSATGLRPVLWSTRTRAAVCCANAGPEQRILLGDEVGNVYLLHFHLSSDDQRAC